MKNMGSKKPFKFKDINVKLSEISEISKRINSPIDLNSLLYIIMEAAKSLINTEGSSLMLMDENGKELKFNVLTGEVSVGTVNSIRVPLGVGIAGIVAETGNPLIVNDACSDPRVYKKVDETAKFTTRNIICVPMKIKDKITGVLEAVNSINRNNFNDDDLSLLKFIADEAAIAINNRQLFNELENANKELANRIRELKALYEISVSSNQSNNINELLDTTLRIISETMNAEKGSLFIYDKKKNKLLNYSSVGIPELEEKKDITLADESIMTDVLKNGQPVLVEDIDTEIRFSKYKKKNYLTKSFLSIPLLINGTPVGIINLSDKKNKESFKEKDLLLIKSISNHLANDFHMYNMKLELIEKERITRELETASAIQKSILPGIFENIGKVKIGAISMPARDVGGDYYDFVVIDENRFVALIADVSGKGIPAALFAALTKNILRMETNNFTTVESILEKANKYIYMDSETSMFVTAAIFMVNHKEKIIEYSFAGHNEQIIYHTSSNKIEILKSKGIPLGIKKNYSYERKVLKYDEGDTLILFTDGATEASNKNMEQFGEENFINSILRHIHMNETQMLHSIKKEILDYSNKENLFDDLTMMIIKL